MWACGGAYDDITFSAKHFPQGTLGRHLVTASVVYSGIYFRGVSEVFSSVGLQLKGPLNKRHAEGGMHWGKKIQSWEGINDAFMGHTSPCLLACLLLPPTSNISVNWFGPSAGRLASMEEWALCVYRQSSCQQRPIGVCKSSNLLLNQSISRGWSCDRICHQQWEELFAAPLENPLNWLICFADSPQFQCPHCGQYSLKAITQGSVETYSTAFRGLCLGASWLHSREKVKRTQRIPQQKEGIIKFGFKNVIKWSNVSSLHPDTHIHPFSTASCYCPW